ncbi:UNKNOWN [Stylonychia lemnae]|uniref:RCC1-like domain-containing protein n=1 Tax=Stylonychia lemnae TaxID=5949 RepID=A0A078ARW5_STYLE|nr:UNKNOWN [Stylonychia lemnae]|eukprot:CDW83932.1 UNKNOWN [Stylonychia lemnae]
MEADSSATDLSLISKYGDRSSHYYHLQNDTKKDIKSNPTQSTTYLYVWGSNQFGQLGIGEKHHGKMIQKPMKYKFPFKIIQISCGNEHTLFLTAQNLVYSMGSNIDGQLGLGTRQIIQKNSPVLVEQLNHIKIVKIASGKSHNIALDREGQCYSWGSNENGQLGLKDNPYTNSQFEANCLVNIDPTKYNIDHISAGGNHSMFLEKISGSLFGCGSNLQGQLGIKETKEYRQPIMIDYPVMHGAFIQLQCGSDYTLALNKYGEVYSCGDNTRLQLGIRGLNQSSQFLKLPTLSNIKKIQAGGYSSALNHQGQLYLWGQTSFGSLSSPLCITQMNVQILFKSISVGDEFGVAIDQIHNFHTWSTIGMQEQHKFGENLNKNSKRFRASQVTCGKDFAIAILSKRKTSRVNLFRAENKLQFQQSNIENKQQERVQQDLYQTRDSDYRNQQAEFNQYNNYQLQNNSRHKYQFSFSNANNMLDQTIDVQQQSQNYPYKDLDCQNSKADLNKSSNDIFQHYKQRYSRSRDNHSHNQFQNNTTLGGDSLAQPIRFESRQNSLSNSHINSETNKNYQRLRIKSHSPSFRTISLPQTANQPSGRPASSELINRPKHSVQTQYLIQIDDLNKQNIILQKQVNELSFQLSQYDASLNEKISEIVQFYDQKIREEKSKRNNLHKEKKNVQDQYKSELLRLMSKVENYEKLMDQQKYQYQVLQQAYDEQYQFKKEQMILINSQQRDVNILTDKCKDLENQLSSQTHINHQVNLDTQILRDEIQQLKKSHVQNLDNLQTFQLQINDFKAREQDYELRLDQKDQEINMLTRQVIDLKQFADSYETELLEYQRQIEDLEDKNIKLVQLLDKNTYNKAQDYQNKVMSILNHSRPQSYNSSQNRNHTRNNSNPYQQAPLRNLNVQEYSDKSNLQSFAQSQNHSFNGVGKDSAYHSKKPSINPYQQQPLSQKENSFTISSPADIPIREDRDEDEFSASNCKSDADNTNQNFNRDQVLNLFAALNDQISPRSLSSSNQLQHNRNFSQTAKPAFQGNNMTFSNNSLNDQNQPQFNKVDPPKDISAPKLTAVINLN